MFPVVEEPMPEPKYDTVVTDSLPKSARLFLPTP